MARLENTSSERPSIIVHMHCPHCGAAQPAVETNAVGRELTFHCLSCGQLIVLEIEKRNPA